MKIAVLAKPPVAGYAKTRLIGPLSPETAAAAHAAMVLCTLQRVEAALGCRPDRDLVLALDRHPGPRVGGSEGDAWLGSTAEQWRVTDQGTGDLGQRLDRIWQEDAGRPTLFLGCDCPDVPFEVMASIPGALQRADACVGPTSDGGYWTLGAGHRQETLLEGIDWGTGSVYHQTMTAARRGGLVVSELRAWRDVDTIEDLTDLRGRLAATREGPLTTLRQRLDELLGGSQR